MNKKVLILICALTFLFAKITAQENQNSKSNTAGIGLYFTNTYPAGKWSEFIKTSLGGGFYVDYMLPLNLNALDLGIDMRLEYGFLIPKVTDIIEQAGDISVRPGFIVRIPFTVGNFNMAFVPELSYGIVIHNINATEESKVNGVYLDQALGVSPALRFSFPRMNILEFELAQISTFAFEDSAVIIQSGFHIGAIWHFDIKK